MDAYEVVPYRRFTAVNLPRLVLAQAGRTPNAVAVRQWDRTLTYAELVGGAARLAAELRADGIGPESTVGVCVRRTPELVVAVLGVLLAGGAYLPLDPDQPARRRDLLLRDAGAATVVTGSMITVADPVDPIDEVPAGPALPDNAAYVMYTSGSTGRPKGVVVTHRSVVNWVLAFAEATGADAGCRSFGFAALGFDASVLDMFVPLAVGGEIELLTEADRVDPTRLQRFVERHEVTWGFVTPAVLPLLDPARLPAWRCLVVGGEPPWPEQVRRWTEDTPRRFFNGYGPTETTVIVCLFEATGTWDRPLPLGRPIAGHQVHVVDAKLRPVPVGVPGELLIGGPGVARGYLGDPARTAQRFIPDPVGGTPGGRVYRTGDVVLRTPDGTLMYQGRTDRQVKLRGQRTEPGEIEAALRAHPGIGHAVVDTVPGPHGPELVAFVTADQPDDAAIRAWCAERLPSFMVPRVVPVAAFPLSATGKVDLPALRELATRAEPDGHTDPITAAWCAALGTDGARPDEDFFASGGHSVAAMRLVAALRAGLGRDVTIEDVFAGRTLGRLAERVAQAPPLDAEVPTGSAPALSPPQRRLWFLDQLAPDSTAYNVALSERLRGPLDVPALRAALAAVARRHEVLRWRIVESDGLPEAVVDPPGETRLPVTDLTAVPPAELAAALHAALDAEAATRIDLAVGPLWRARLFRLGVEEHVLALTVHHAVFDGWSQAPLYADLGRAYDQSRSTRRRIPELAAPPSTFADYVTWRADRDHRRAEADLRWWVEYLADVPRVVDLPRDHPRPPVQTYGGRTAHATVDSAITRSVTELAGELATTPSTVLLAAFGELLRRLTGRRDLVIGTPAADRRHLAFHDLVGFFVEIVPLRLRPDPDLDFAAQVRACRDVVLDALAHPATPLDRIVDALAAERDPSRAPLVQVLFNVYNFPEPRLRLAGLRTEPIRPSMPGSPFDLTVYVTLREDRFAVDVLYNPDLFDAARIEALLAAYTELIAELTGAPGRAVGAAPMRPLAEGVPDLPRAGTGSTRSAGPLSPTERAIERVWREVLGLATVGVHDNFFDVGGNSLALATVRSRLQTVLGRDLRLVDLFLHPTVRVLAEFLDGKPVDTDLDRIALRVAERRERSRRRTAIRARATGRDQDHLGGRA